MDRSKYTRPAQNIASHTQKNNTFGISTPPVPKVASARPQADGHAISVRIDTNTMSRMRRRVPTQSRPVVATPAAAPTQAVPAPTPTTAPTAPRAPLTASLMQHAVSLQTNPVEPALTDSTEAPTQPAPVLARQTPIDMELPGADSQWQLNASVRHSRWRRIRRNAARVVAVSLVIIITLGGMLFSQSYMKLHKVFKGGTGTAAALKENVAPELLKGEGRGRVNVLLLGRGGGTHDAPDLTDTMMLASIDPVNHTASLLSIPRDLWVNVPGQGVMKLNAAWETGEFKYLGKAQAGSTDPKAIQAGYDMVDQTVGGILGVTIDYNVLVDFQAFKQAVDTVGGVQVNVPTDLVDPTMAWENSNNPVLAKAGLQTFNGTQALLYARSRETSSDFARAERQRTLMVALKGKVETLGTLSNPMKLSSLLSAFGNNVQTDLSLSNASRLYSILKGIDNGKVNSISLADAQDPYVTTGNMNGQSIVLPKAGLFNYSDIQTFVRGQLKDPYILKENAKIMVLNGTSTPGVATTKAAELKSYGYNVVSVGNTPQTSYTQTTLVDLTHKDKYTKNYLEQRLGVTADTHLADQSIATNGADFAIIIGSDEATNTQP